MIPGGAPSSVRARLGTAILMACLPAGASAQILTGGDFDVLVHGLGPGMAASAEVAGDTLTLRSFERGILAGAYPLQGTGGHTLLPVPFGFSFYSHQVNNLIPGSAGTVEVTLSKFSVAQDFDFYVNTEPTLMPLRVDPSRIEQANAGLSLSAGPRASLVPQGIVELNLFEEFAGYRDKDIDQPARLEFTYNDANGDGMVDGANPPIRAKKLAIYVLDEARGLWVRMPNSSVDAVARKVSTPLSHFSVYGLIGTADTEVERVYAFPVPWAPNSGDPMDGTLGGGITFTNLPSEGSIDIFTISGQKVRALSISPFLPVPQLKWDVKTEGGQNVVSGVYIWRIQAGSNVKTGKLMVVR